MTLALSMEDITGIAGYSNITFTKIEPVDKGWSNDRKYYIETADGRKLLLRVADISEHARKKTEFDMMKQIAALGVPMSLPLKYGTCNDGKSVYTLLTWCEGEDAADILPYMTETEQYVLGVKAGEILRLMHTIPAPESQEEWGVRFNRKTSIKIERYKACGIRFDGDDKIINYIEGNRSLLSGRPQCYQHGDYHVGNMIVSKDKAVPGHTPANHMYTGYAPANHMYTGYAPANHMHTGYTLSIIDFNRPDFGDPWEEYNRIEWSAQASPYFATGQLNGYFGGRPPDEFFRLLAFYIGSNALSSIYWAIPFGKKEIDTMMNQVKDILSWFYGMTNLVPTWYLADFYVQYIDNVPYKLKAPFDMSFIRQYGEVFKVFDDQDSGNICFGVRAEGNSDKRNNDKRGRGTQDGWNRYFIKFAGAPTEQYSGAPEDAIERLKAAVPVYRNLAHPNLIRFIKAEEVGECEGEGGGRGFAAIFEWVDGECMGRMYPLSRRKFLLMPNSARLEVFDAILEFHAYVNSKGYVAIDFYDGSIMYDFDAKKTVICDIDFYAKMPYTNSMGRMWGSSRFMSPEESKLGSTIDELTNVFLMGATAFVLFFDGDSAMTGMGTGEVKTKTRTLDNWQLSEGLYRVAFKAFSDDRSQRQQSIRQFIYEWNQARKMSGFD